MTARTRCTGSDCGRWVDLDDEATVLDAAPDITTGQLVRFGYCPNCAPSARLHPPSALTPPCCIGGECAVHRQVRKSRERSDGRATQVAGGNQWHAST